jgi:hypothetical protein
MQKNIYGFLKSLVFIIFVSFSIGQCVYADNSVNLMIKNNGAPVFSGQVFLPTEGTVNIVDTNGNTHGINTRSVLNIVKEADVTSSDFNISNLIYYSMFDAFYLKCITPVSSTELCDGWQYKINGTDPGIGMDQSILSGGENIILYFGQDDGNNTFDINGASGGGPVLEYVPPSKVETPQSDTLTTVEPTEQGGPLVENMPEIITFGSQSKEEGSASLGIEDSKKETKKSKTVQIENNVLPSPIVHKSNYATINVATPILALEENQNNKVEKEKESIFLKIIKMIFGF